MNLNTDSFPAFTKDLLYANAILFSPLVIFQVIHPKLLKIVNLEKLNYKATM